MSRAVNIFFLNHYLEITTAVATLILLNYLCGLLTDSKHPDLHPCFAFSVCESKTSLVPAAPSGRASSLPPGAGEGGGVAAWAALGPPAWHDSVRRNYGGLQEWLCREHK